MNAPDPAHRGVGAVFMVFGALSCLMMSAAALYAEGRLSFLIPTAAWSQLYMAHYGCAVFCAAAYLWLGWRRTGSIPRLAIMLFAVGMVVYSTVFVAVGLLLLKKLLPSWGAVLPGGFLLWYGWTLRRDSFLSLPGRPKDGL